MARHGPVIFGIPLLDYPKLARVRWMVCRREGHNLGFAWWCVNCGAPWWFEAYRVCRLDER
jgi:hypothetical protein